MKLDLLKCKMGGDNKSKADNYIVVIKQGRTMEEIATIVSDPLCVNIYPNTKQY